MNLRNLSVLPWNGQVAVTFPASKLNYRLTSIYFRVSTSAVVADRQYALEYREGGVQTFIDLVTEPVADLVTARFTWAPNLPIITRDNAAGTELWQTIPLPSGVIITPNMRIVLTPIGADVGDGTGGLVIVRDFLQVGKNARLAGAPAAE